MVHFLKKKENQTGAFGLEAGVINKNMLEFYFYVGLRQSINLLFEKEKLEELVTISIQAEFFLKTLEI